MSKLPLNIFRLGIFLSLGLLLTIILLKAAFFLGDLDWICVPFLLPLYAVVYGGSSILPYSVTIPHDPVGHPTLWWVGLFVNAIFLAYALHWLFKYSRGYE